MISYAALAKKVYSAFVKANAPIVNVCRPTFTENGAARTVTEVTPRTWLPARAFILPASKGTVEAFDNRREDDALKGKELRYLKIAAYGLAITPRSGDLLSFAGATWLVLGCTPVDPSGAVPLVHGVGVVST